MAGGRSRNHQRGDVANGFAREDARLRANVDATTRLAGLVGGDQNALIVPSNGFNRLDKAGLTKSPLQVVRTPDAPASNPQHRRRSRRMAEAMAKSAVTLAPGEGRRVGARPTGGGATLKVGIGDSAGTLSIFESAQPPGDLPGPPLHRHGFDESFYVLEGDYLFKLGDRTLTATVGSFVYIPGGMPHAFRRVGSGGGRMLTICHPGGIEEMFEGGPDERAAVEKKLGAEFVGPPLDAEAD